MAERLARFSALVYPHNRHSGYGERVVVIAATHREAVARAKYLAGWVGNPSDAQVTFTQIEDIDPRDCPRAPGHDGECAPGDRPDRPEVTP